MRARRGATVGMLAAWTAAWWVVRSRHGALSWHYFVSAARQVPGIGPGGAGLHLYAVHPELQFGPVAIAASAALVAVMGARSPIGGQLVCLLAGAAILVVVRGLTRARSADPVGAPGPMGAPPPTPGWSWVDDPGAVLAAALFVPVWMDVAVKFVHVDDVLVLLSAVLAMRALDRGRPLTAAALLGLAVDAKPWAVPLVALLLCVPAPQRLRAGLVAAGVVAAAWLPFVAVDSRSLAAARFRIPVDPTSALSVLGVSSGGTPSWDRGAQAALGLVLAVAAIRRGRPAAVLLLVVLARLALDPATKSYYAAGVLVGAAVFDAAGRSRAAGPGVSGRPAARPRRWPWWTVAAFVAFFILPLGHDGLTPAARPWLWQPLPTHGWVTLAAVLAVAVAATSPARRPRDRVHGGAAALPPHASATTDGGRPHPLGLLSDGS